MLGGGNVQGNVLDLTEGSAPTVFLGQLIERHHITTQVLCTMKQIGGLSPYVFGRWHPQIGGLSPYVFGRGHPQIGGLSPYVFGRWHPQIGGLSPYVFGRW